MKTYACGLPFSAGVFVKPLLRSKGFTLIEVMIVVVIVAILALIAFPSYQSYIRKAKRADAKAMMLRVQVEEEKWRTNNTQYTATLSSLGLSTTSPEGLYTISVTESNGTTAYSPDGLGYTVKAVAVSGTSQANDTGCTTLYLRAGDHISGSTSPEKSPSQCW